VKEFGYQDEKFAAKPGAVLKIALSQIEDDEQSRDEYNHVLLPLVYVNRPEFRGGQFV
jgi:hypothetical protein